MTKEMLSLQWINLAMYPAGYFARRIQIEPSVRFPTAGRRSRPWKPLERRRASPTTRPSTSTSSSRPSMIAGRYARQIDLDPGAPAPVHLDVIADRPNCSRRRRSDREAQGARAASLQAVRRPPLQSLRLPVRFPTACGSGLEHHFASSEDAPSPTTTASPRVRRRGTCYPTNTPTLERQVPPPCGPWTPNFNVPMRGSSLYAYEGWDAVLGPCSPAAQACSPSRTSMRWPPPPPPTPTAGREWRPVEDTTNDPVIACVGRSPGSATSAARTTSKASWSGSTPTPRSAKNPAGRNPRRLRQGLLRRGERQLV